MNAPDGLLVMIRDGQKQRVEMQTPMGPTTMIVNAATNPVMGPLLETDLDAWRKILEVNLTGALLTARAAGQTSDPLLDAAIAQIGTRLN